MMTLPIDAFLPQLPQTLAVDRLDNGQVMLRPDSPQMLQAAIEVANAARMPVWVHGCPSAPAPGQPAVGLTYEAMNQVIRLRPEELLISVEAGMTIGALQDHLVRHRLTFPLAYAPDRPLVQLLAEEALSLSATRYGPLRRWVVGLHAVTGDGQAIHYGGEVVKNVTGYDMSKLFIGSHHQYGLITQAVLKVATQPETRRTMLFHADDLQQALSLCQKITVQVPDPEFLALFKTKTSFGWQVLLGLSGYKDRVHCEAEGMHEALAGLNMDLQELFLAPQALSQWLTRLDWTHPNEPEALVLRLALPQKAIRDFPYRLSSLPWLKAADVLMPLGTQQLFLRWISVQIPDIEDLKALQFVITELGGLLEVVRIPPNWSHPVAPLNAPTSAVLAQWQQRLKQQYDPNGILLPRFPSWCYSPTEVK